MVYPALPQMSESQVQKMNAELASLKDELSQLKIAEPVRALFGAGWGCSRRRAVVDGGSRLIVFVCYYQINGR